jgi:glycosyltransferase involved in cell wall biosynthesis
MEAGAVAITTRNRREIFERSYGAWKKYLPFGWRLVVVDDASDVPCPVADYRFDSQQGIAKAKNKALSLVDDCRRIFLVDDDVYPVRADWYVPYINTGLKHMCLSFERNSKGRRLSHSVYLIRKRPEYWIYNAPNGCMLYLDNSVLAAVGGMNTDFDVWGREHETFSWRIHNSGLTPYPFMDIPESIKYFHVSDYYGEVQSSVPQADRIRSIRTNTPLYDIYKKTDMYVEYR